MYRGSLILACYLGSSVAGLSLLWACNDHDPHPPNSTDPGNTVNPATGGGSSGTTDGGLTEASTNVDAGECSNLDDPTTRIDEDNVNDVVPPALGGDLTLINATYDLETAQRYVGATGQAGPNGVTYREVIRITGGNTLERNRVSQLSGGPEQPQNATFTLQSVSANTIALSQTCPTIGSAESFSFTLQNGKLTLTSASGESFTYTPRP